MLVSHTLTAINGLSKAMSMTLPVCINDIEADEQQPITLHFRLQMTIPTSVTIDLETSSEIVNNLPIERVLKAPRLSFGAVVNCSPLSLLLQGNCADIYRT